MFAECIPKINISPKENVNLATTKERNTKKSYHRFCVCFFVSFPSLCLSISLSDTARLTFIFLPSASRAFFRFMIAPKMIHHRKIYF